MKINLTKEEAKYLRSHLFWDWKRAEIDEEMARLIRPDKTDTCKKRKDFYGGLYHKLGGEE